mmetsp:Transcript_71358/g.231909  ORF Transcript_71358/g.231909 Transcript_71358/m.231909 type:complete len:708 (-) Transcript_71358:120-2243(-)
MQFGALLGLVLVLFDEARVPEQFTTALVKGDYEAFLVALAQRKAFPIDRCDTPNPIAEKFYFEHLFERKDAFMDLLRKWHTNFVMEGDRAKAPLVTLPSAPGTGKTRFAWVAACRGRVSPGNVEPEWTEAIQGLADLKDLHKFKEAITGAVAVTVTFNFGKEPRSEEKHAHMVGVRMLHSHFSRGSDFGEFLTWLRDRDCATVEAIRALYVIRKDIDSKLGCEPTRHIILVVDEPLATVDGLNDADRKTKLGELCSTVGVILSDFPDVHVLMTSLSGPELEAAVTPASKRPLVFVEQFCTLSSTAVERLVCTATGSQQITNLRDQRFRSVLRDCLGIPRLVESTMQAAGTVCSLAGWSVDTISGEVSKVFSGARKYPNFSYRRDALFAALTRYRVHCEVRDARTQVAEREGYLFGNQIPPILLRWWLASMMPGSADEAAVLLKSANQIISFSDIRDGASHGKPFERQLAHLWRILTVTDTIWRSEQSGERKPRTVLGMLGKGCVDLARTSVAKMSDTTASFNRALAHVESDLLCGGFVELKKPAVGPTDVPAELEVGTTYFPEDPQNPGFDFAVVDKLADSEGVLLTVVEAKYSGEGATTKLGNDDIAKTFKNALQERPELQKVFLDGRLCYVIGGMMRVQDSMISDKKGVVSAIAAAVVKIMPNNKDMMIGLVERSLVVLNRAHVQVLLSPTLSRLPPFSYKEDED